MVKRSGSAPKAPKKQRTARFRITFTVEARVSGDPLDARPDVEGAVTTLVDEVLTAPGANGEFNSHGVTLTDAVDFGCEVEES